LQVGQPLQEQDALDELVGMLHLVDGFLVGVLAQLLQAPAVEHAGMQEIQVDGRQLVLQDVVEVTQDGRVALHVCSWFADSLLQGGASRGRVSRESWRAGRSQATARWRSEGGRQRRRANYRGNTRFGSGGNGTIRRFDMSLNYFPRRFLAAAAAAGDRQ